MKHGHTKEYYLKRLEVEKIHLTNRKLNEIQNKIRIWKNCNGEFKCIQWQLIEDRQTLKIKIEDKTPVNKYGQLPLIDRLIIYSYFNDIKNLTTTELKYIYDYFNLCKHKITTL